MIKSVVAVQAYNDKMIIIKKMVSWDRDPLYFWFICNSEKEVLSDNTKDCGEDSIEKAIAIAKSVIDRFC